MIDYDYKTYFVWDGRIKTLVDHLNQADVAFWFDVDYPGKAQRKDPDIHGKATRLTLNGHDVEIGDLLIKDEHSTWHVVRRIQHANDNE